MRTIAATLALTLAAGGVGIAIPAGAAPTSTAKADVSKAVTRYCRSLDDFIRFLRKAPKPSKFDTERGRKVLRHLEKDAPRTVKAAAHTVAENFRTMSQDGKKGLTPDQHRATNAAMIKVAVFGATKCDQKLIKSFGSAMVQARLAAAERNAKDQGSDESEK